MRYIWPTDRTLTDTTTVELWVMAIKNSTLYRASKLDPHHPIQFGVIPRTPPILRELTPLLSPVDWGVVMFGYNNHILKGKWLLWNRDMNLFNYAPPQAWCDARSIFCRVKVYLNSEFSSSLDGCLTKTKEASLPCYLLIAE